MDADEQVPYRATSRKGGQIWVVGCLICKVPITLGLDEGAAQRMVRRGPVVHEECRDKSSRRTPALDGMASFND